MVKVIFRVSSFSEFKELLKEIKKVKEDNPHMKFEFHIEVVQ